LHRAVGVGAAAAAPTRSDTPSASTHFAERIPSFRVTPAPAVASGSGTQRTSANRRSMALAGVGSLALIAVAAMTLVYSRRSPASKETLPAVDTPSQSPTPSPTPVTQPTTSASDVPTTAITAGSTSATPAGVPAAPATGSGKPASQSVAVRFDQASIDSVVAAHRTELNRTCWEPHAAFMKSAWVNVDAAIEPDGHVSSSSVRDTAQSPPSAIGDRDLGRCVTDQVRSWQFPPPGQGRRRLIVVQLTFGRNAGQ
jgi:hypothetical protein